MKLFQNSSQLARTFQGSSTIVQDSSGVFRTKTFYDILKLAYSLLRLFKAVYIIGQLCGGSGGERSPPKIYLDPPPTHIHTQNKSSTTGK